MEEKKEKKPIIEVKSSTSNFKTVKDSNSYKSFNEKKNDKTKIGFGRSVLVPFASGVLGCA